MVSHNRVTKLVLIAVVAATSVPSICNEAYSEGLHSRKTESSHHHVPTVTQSIRIEAPPKFVFSAIQHARKVDTRKLLSYDGADATIEEKFMTIPVVGAATCTYVEHEIPNQQGIEYHLVNSDRFTVFQGKWSLTPGKDGKSTTVELTNAMDPGIRIPFWQEITKLAAGKSVKRRLDEVSGYALAIQSGQLQPDSIYTR